MIVCLEYVLRQSYFESIPKHVNRFSQKMNSYSYIYPFIAISLIAHLNI